MTQLKKPSKYTDFYVKLQDADNLREIKPYHNELNSLREKKLNSTINYVTEIRIALENLKTDACRNILENPEEAQYLRTRMSEVEEKISHLKEVIRQELVLLVKDRVNLCKELEVLGNKTEEWGNPVSSINSKSAKSKGYNRVNKHGHNENATTELQKFLSASGGHYGGWKEQDHLFFLRERKRHKKKELFFYNVHCLLPDLTYDEIAKHDCWYIQYESLKNSQKQAIRKWKHEKMSIQKQKLENLNENKNTKFNGKPGHQKNIIWRIKKWKEQKLTKKMEEEERQRIEKETLQKEEEKKKGIQRLKKLAVNLYKAEKLRELHEEIQNNNRDQLLVQETKAKNRILIKSFRLQDNKFVERKRMIRLQLESKGNNKVDGLKLAKPAIDFALQRDPQRIFQPTLIWTLHCRHKESKQNNNPAFDLNSIPRLAVPEWRRELK